MQNEGAEAIVRIYSLSRIIKLIITKTIFMYCKNRFKVIPIESTFKAESIKSIWKDLESDKKRLVYFQLSH